MEYPKRLIEVDLPIKRISAHARREKSIRHGNISTLHIWWARRPLAACRAVICAALWPDPADPLCPEAFKRAADREVRIFAKEAAGSAEINTICDSESWQRYNVVAKNNHEISLESLRNLLLDFIADFSSWEASVSKPFLQTARNLTQAAHEALGGTPGTRPLVVDPFAGGGAIPLEALRVGADAFASDLNPVAVLINKVVLEYIPKYKKRLAVEVRKWGQWVIDQAEKELSKFYPKDADGATPIAYLWARTIKCEGPGCGAEVPLITSQWLSKKKGHSIAIIPIPRQRQKRVDFRLIKNPKPSEIGNGTMARSSATCPCCGYTTPAAKVRAQFKGRYGGSKDSRLMAVCTLHPNRKVKSFREVEKHDIESANDAVKALAALSRGKNQDGLSAVPLEKLPYLRSIFNIKLLDVNHWCELFSPRQMIALSTLWRLSNAAMELFGDSLDPQLREATITCLALAIDKVSAQCTTLSWWQPKGEFVVGTFGRQALGIIWDYAEIRPMGGASGDLDNAIDWVCRVIEGMVDDACVEGHAMMSSAVSHPLPDSSADFFFTDPPYYDSVPYADLSDFFYTQLRRMLKNVHPSLFTDELTPKKGEVTQLAERNPMYSYKTKEYFESNMQAALVEGRRLLKPNGLGNVVFAHKSTDGWEAMLSAVINSGWVVTSSWPIDTERAVRIRAKESAALASSIHISCRPRADDDQPIVGDWRDVLAALPKRIREWLPRLAKEGVVGADAIFACIGPALEVFSRYSRVEKASSEQVSLREYLGHVWAAVSKEALAMIFSGADATGFEEDARLTAMWLWTLTTADSRGKASKMEVEDEANSDENAVKKSKKITGGYSLEYDAARKIAQGLGVHLEKLGNLVEIKGETARLLSVAERTKALFGKDQAAAPKGRKKASQLSLFEELDDSEGADGGWGEKTIGAPGVSFLDRLHQGMILFAAGRGEALKRFLTEEGVGKDQRYWKLAQALSALYPDSSDEKRWVDGVMARKKSLGL